MGNGTSQVYYGFVNGTGDERYRGQLVRVNSNTSKCNDDCEKLGLVSLHECCWNTFERFENLPSHKVSSGYLGPGIVDFTVFTLPYQLANWMSSVSDGVLISKMRLPASHDAGSAQTDNVTPFVGGIINELCRTQAFSILNQLIMGIRAFDIRPTRAGNGAGKEDGQIWTHHSGYKGESLGRATRCAKMFLTAYPSEVIIFYVSHELNCSLNDAYNVIRDVMGYSYFVESNETVGNLRGKLVILKMDKLQQNVPWRDHDGRETWSELVPWLNQIQPRDGQFNRFPAALTPKYRCLLTKTPAHLALSDGLPGLERWLNSNESNNIGIVEADWFGDCDCITRLVELIVRRNRQ